MIIRQNRISKVLLLAFIFLALDVVHAQTTIETSINDVNDPKINSSLATTPNNISTSDAQRIAVDVPTENGASKTIGRQSRDGYSQHSTQSSVNNFNEKPEQPTNQARDSSVGLQEGDVQPITIDIPEDPGADEVPSEREGHEAGDVLPYWLMGWPISILVAGVLFLCVFATKLLKSINGLMKNFQSTTHAQSRAYLSLNVIAVHPSSENDLPTVVLEVRNEGQTPAHSVDLAAGVHVLAHPIRNNAAHPEMYFYAKMNTLFSSAPNTIGVCGQHPLSKDQMNSIFLGETQRLYVHAFVSYKDIYNHTHFSMLCLSIFNLRLAGNNWTASFEHAPLHNNIGTLIL